MNMGRSKIVVPKSNGEDVFWSEIRKKALKPIIRSVYGSRKNNCRWIGIIAVHRHRWLCWSGPREKSEVGGFIAKKKATVYVAIFLNKKNPATS